MAKLKCSSIFKGLRKNNLIFYKFSGSGNDFVIIDNRKKIFDETNLKDFARKVCRRGISIGADGLILVEESDLVDFKWRFFNADGTMAQMCGNGARCVARFAVINKIAGAKMSFETIAGIVSAEVSHDLVKISIPDPDNLKLDYKIMLKSGPLTVSSVNTGVPHVLIVVDDENFADVVKTGREIRHHKKFAPDGTNVNFITQNPDGVVAVRTYERGVEDETLACGTGAIAGALLFACKANIPSPVKVKTRSNEYLNIYYKKNRDKFYNIELEGDARLIYRGKLFEDALK